MIYNFKHSIYLVWQAIAHSKIHRSRLPNHFKIKKIALKIC